MGPINNIPPLVQITAWRRPGDKPLSEPTMVSLLTHIRPQWVNVIYLISQVPDAQGKGQVLTSHIHCRMKLFVPTKSYFWHNPLQYSPCLLHWRLCYIYLLICVCNMHGILRMLFMNFSLEGHTFKSRIWVFQILIYLVLRLLAGLGCFVPCTKLF